MKIKKTTARCLSLLLVGVILIMPMVSAGTLTAFASSRAAFDSDPVPVNPNANQTCKNFYQYLWNVGKSNSVISGAVSSKLYGLNTNTKDAESDYYEYIKDLFGVTPIISGNIFTVSQLGDDLAVTIAERYKNGAVPQFQLDPGSAASLTDKADGIVHYDETNPNRDMVIYNSYVNDREKMGNFFKKLESLGVEVYIVRLFIENNNSSKQGFFGETTTGFSAFKRVWKRTVDYFINECGLTGILFTYAPAGFRESSDYYPGDDCVDINGPTVYANSSDGEILFKTDCADYVWMKNIKRPFAFTELAARSAIKPQGVSPIGDYKSTIESVLYAYPEISFFSLWYENQFSLEPSNGSSSIGNYNGEYFIRHPSVITLEKAVDYRSSTPVKGIGYSAFYTDAYAKQKAFHLGLGDYSSGKLKEMGIDLSKVQSMDVMFGCAVKVYQSDDCKGPSNIFFEKGENLGNIFKNAKSVSVVSLKNLALEKDVWSDNFDKNIYKVNDGKDDRYVTESVNSDGTLSVDIDLGGEFVVGQVSINHAGFFEDFIYNTRDFAVYTSTDDNKYTMVYKTVGNTFPASNVSFNPVKAQYVRVKILKGNSSAAEIERKRIAIAEISVYGLEDSGFSNLTIPGASSKPPVNTIKPGTVSDYPNGTDFGDSDVIVDLDEDTEDTPENKNNNSEIIIPEFYNYVWIIICAGFAAIAGIVWLVLFLLSKRRNHKSTG